MCNLYDVGTEPTGKQIAEAFQVVGEIPLPPKPSIWPLYQGLFIHQRTDGPGREAELGQWGLVPHWAPDMKFGRGKNNARAETVSTLPTFRSAYKTRRCLIPARWFCEQWQKVWYRFTLPAQPLYAMAGLSENWGAEKIIAVVVHNDYDRRE